MDITNFISNGITYPIGDTKSRESIAAAFDSTASYSEGDYVMYDGTLYKFTSSHSGEWNTSHVEATCVTDELGSGGSGGNAKVMYFYEQTVNTATNAEIFRITSSKINTDTVVLECTFANPSYITSDVTWTSYEGYIAFTGTCTTATTANVTMAYKTENSISNRLLTLLWENPSPSSSFAAQTINLDLSNYDEIMISFAHYTDDMTQSSYIIMKNDNWHPCRVMKSTYVTDTYRNVKATNIGITFSSGFNPQTNQNDTSCAIPLKIYGVSRYSEFTSSHINPVDVTTKTRVATANSGPINAYVVPKNGYYAVITHTNQTSHEAAAVIAADSDCRNLYSSNYSATKAWLSLTTEWIWLKEGTTIYWSITYVSDSRYANDLGLFCADPVS